MGKGGISRGAALGREGSPLSLRPLGLSPSGLFQARLVGDHVEARGRGLATTPGNAATCVIRSTRPKRAVPRRGERWQGSAALAIDALTVVSLRARTVRVCKPRNEFVAGSCRALLRVWTTSRHGVRQGCYVSPFPPLSLGVHSLPDPWIQLLVDRRLASPAQRAASISIVVWPISNSPESTSALSHWRSAYITPRRMHFLHYSECWWTET